MRAPQCFFCFFFQALVCLFLFGAANEVERLIGAMPRGEGVVELRVDRSDGNAYPLESFLEVYGLTHGRTIWDGSEVRQSHCRSDAASSRGAPVSGQHSGTRPRRKKRKFQATSNRSSGTTLFTEMPALAFVSICDMCSVSALAALSRCSVLCRRRCFCRLRWRRYNMDYRAVPHCLRMLGS